MEVELLLFNEGPTGTQTSSRGRGGKIQTDRQTDKTETD